MRIGPNWSRTCGGLAFGGRPFLLASASEHKDRDGDDQGEEEKEQREARIGSEGAERIRVDGDGPRLRLLVTGDIGRPNGEGVVAIREGERHARGESDGQERPAVNLDLKPPDAGTRIGCGPVNRE